MQPLSFFFDDTTALHLAESADGYRVSLLHGGTALLKERLLQTISAVWHMTEQIHFYQAQRLCCVQFPKKKQMILDADRLAVCPVFGCPTLETNHISLDICYDPAVLQTHAEAIRYSFSEYHSNAENAAILQATAMQAFSAIPAGISAAILESELPVFPLPEHKHTSGNLQIRMLQGCTAQGVFMQPLPSDWEMIVLKDAWYAAGSRLLEDLAMTAVQQGWDCILCMHPMHTDGLPVQLLLPERKQAYIVQGSLFGEVFPNRNSVSLQHCYQKERLQTQTVQVQLTAALLQSSMKAYMGMLRMMEGVQAVMEQYYQTAEQPAAIAMLADRLCADL